MIIDNAEQAMAMELLYFGSVKPHGQVSADDWRIFVDNVVTSRFPDGFTAWPASGQWQDASGTVVREASWVLNVVHAPGEQADAAIAEIVAAWRHRFAQESVLRITSAACVAF